MPPRPNNPVFRAVAQTTWLPTSHLRHQLQDLASTAPYAIILVTPPATSASSSPICRGCTHYQCSGHSHSRHQRSTHKHRPHQIRRESTSVLLPRKVQRAIVHGEFVDFSDLLCDHLTWAEKSVKTKKATQTQHIANLDTWLEAWTLYAIVLATAKPQLAPELFKYQAFITRTSQRFQPYTWLQYDSQFRLRLAANRSMQWLVADPELTATWLSADATKAKQPCFSCGSPDHLAPHFPLKASVAGPGLHCPICNHLGHTARDCPLLHRSLPHIPRANPLSVHPLMTTTISVVYTTKEPFVFRVQSVHTCTHAQPVREATHNMPAPSRHTDIRQQL